MESSVELNRSIIKQAAGPSAPGAAMRPIDPD
jgi:hypothetical protein